MSRQMFILNRYKVDKLNSLIKVSMTKKVVKKINLITKNKAFLILNKKFVTNKLENNFFLMSEVDH